MLEWKKWRTFISHSLPEKFMTWYNAYVDVNQLVYLKLSFVVEQKVETQASRC